ncbi:hypothetical protein ACFP1H_02330 [Secundilactobacillus hailunensis]|uniref:Lactococcin 972 family bacteriocin n=1 Tax=Secundilactobacillus hailunensis TaxID=2559923 RepID=A0ABW1T8S6_9LACO|nr:hypothetical protein [Secundilactobacillus hailunensis]
MQKSLLTALAVGIGLAGGTAFAPTTASAKIISNMPAHFHHTWYSHHWKMKFTKHYLQQGKTGHRYNLNYHFKHVSKYGNRYTPEVMADIGAFKYSHGYMYTYDGSGAWQKWHR